MIHIQLRKLKRKGIMTCVYCRESVLLYATSETVETLRWMLKRIAQQIVRAVPIFGIWAHLAK